MPHLMPSGSHLLISSLLQPWEVGRQCHYSAHFGGENLRQREVKSLVPGHIASWSMAGSVWL